MRTSDGLTAHGLSFCGLAAMGGGGEEAGGAQFRTLETQGRRVLTVISSQKEKSGLSSAAQAENICIMCVGELDGSTARMTFLDRQLLPAGTQKGRGKRKATAS